MDTFDLIAIQEQIVQYITPNIMWVIFLVAAGLTILASLMVMWHWDKYAIGLLRKVSIESTYLIITGSLGFLVLVSVITYVAGY